MYGKAVNSNEPSIRLLIFYGSILKLQQMARAAELLAQGGFVEEIQAVGRTMAEITINAAYLQDAEDEEIDRFRHFDTQCAFKHATRLRPHASTKLTSEELQRIEAVAQQARRLTGRKDIDTSWSKRTLLQRAEYSDKNTRLDIMKVLALTSYAQGHSAIHGTFDSLHPFICSVTDSRSLSGENREEDLTVAIAGVNFALSIACLYFNSLMKLDCERAIVAAGKMGSA
jgi:hypothetical protein